ncbi:hypothetical protein GOODEAATRI_034389 [Goodea atripinnis]|uniref:Secreted protein n=1 Tax=Goodea atripinnis TaxID=208336 RepID=A0ABV0NZZ6_9TELE
MHSVKFVLFRRTLLWVNSRQIPFWVKCCGLWSASNILLAWTSQCLNDHQTKGKACGHFTSDVFYRVSKDKVSCHKTFQYAVPSTLKEKVLKGVHNEDGHQGLKRNLFPVQTEVLLTWHEKRCEGTCATVGIVCATNF